MIMNKRDSLRFDSVKKREKIIFVLFSKSKISGNIQFSLTNGKRGKG